jgi:hypothetical protein
VVRGVQGGAEELATRSSKANGGGIFFISAKVQQRNNVLPQQNKDDPRSYKLNGVWRWETRDREKPSPKPGYIRARQRNAVGCTANADIPIKMPERSTRDRQDQVSEGRNQPNIWKEGGERSARVTSLASQWTGLRCHLQILPLENCQELRVQQTRSHHSPNGCHIKTAQNEPDDQDPAGKNQEQTIETRSIQPQVKKRWDRCQG